MDNLIVGVTLCLIGAFMGKVYTDEPSLLGYKSMMANKNKDTWVTAQKISGKLSIVAGIINLIAFGILYLLHSVNNGIPTFAVIFITLFGMFIITEVKLRKIFNADGTRRDPGQGITGN